MVFVQHFLFDQVLDGVHIGSGTRCGCIHFSFALVTKVDIFMFHLMSMCTPYPQPLDFEHNVTFVQDCK